MKVAIKVDGGPELARRLEALAGRLRREIMEEALLAAGETLRDEMAARAPVRSGGLRRSIVVAPDKRQPGTVRVGPGRPGGPHGHLVERGTAPRVTRRTGAFRGAMPARPFVAPAMMAKRDEAGRVAAAVIRRRLGDV